VDARRDDTLEKQLEVSPVAPDIAPPVMEATDAVDPPIAPLAAGARGRRFGLFHLSPINERRWRNFKSNRRGYWALWIFLGLFITSLFAEVIANDRPILVRYKGEILFPILVDYPEEKFGGFLAVTDYKDPVILDEIQKNGWMIWPPIRYSYNSINKDFPRVKGPEDRCLGYPAPPPCSAPTTRAATWSPASSTGSGSPCCSG
jgi:hypothetical protein